MDLSEEEEEPPPPPPPPSLEATVTVGGPEGGCVTALALDDTGATDVLYAGTFRAGIYKSSDAGAIWALSSTGFNRNLTVTDMAIDPVTAANVVAVTGLPNAGGLYLSVDSGATWIDQSAGLPHLDLRCLTVPGADTYYVGTGGLGLWVGTYSATTTLVTWVQAQTTGLNNLIITDIVTSGNDIFVSTAGGGVFYADTTTLPGSWTWSAVNSGLSTLDILCLAYEGDDLYTGSNGQGTFLVSIAAAAAGTGTWTALSPAGSAVIREIAVTTGTPDPLYITTPAGFYRSTDGGTTWLTPSSIPSDSSLLRVLVHPLTATTLFVSGCSGGIFQSVNSGDNWTTLGTVGSMIVAGDFAALAVDPQSVGNTVVYAGMWSRETDGSSRGAFKTINDGLSWSNFSDSTTLQYGDIRVMAVDPASASIVYAATWGGGVYRSPNGGTTWTAVTTGLGSNHVSAFVLDAAAPTHLIAGTDAGIYRSTDSGTLWTGALTQPPASRATLGLTGVSGTFADGETVSGGTSSATGLVISGGGTSTLLVECTTGTFVTTETLTGGTSAATATVNTATFQWFVEELVQDPHTATTFWCVCSGVRGGVYTTTDSGINWNATAAQPASNALTCIALDPVSATTLYAGSADNGIFRSIDAGVTWTEANTNLGPVEIHHILPDERVTGVHALFTATARGLFLSTDLAATWKQVVDATPVNAERPELKTLLRLGLDPLVGNEKVLWAATGGRGLLRVELP
jgi:hypothetical protein